MLKDIFNNCWGILRKIQQLQLQINLSMVNLLASAEHTNSQTPPSKPSFHLTSLLSAFRPFSPTSKPSLHLPSLLSAFQAFSPPSKHSHSQWNSLWSLLCHLSLVSLASTLRPPLDISGQTLWHNAGEWISWWHALSFTVALKKFGGYDYDHEDTGGLVLCKVNGAAHAIMMASAKINTII